ncbi:hypothetical protein [Paenarthrobacter aromaticivorans]|uniref:hypothetical protein n=1 Tax=Paenarthrobacter aromaticivorans TaxID=2849150 RepID=UPI003A803DEC
MKKRRTATPAPELVETSRTGHHCPKTGWWSVAGDPRATRLITKGEVMPALHGTPALWIMREAAGIVGETAARPAADLLTTS